MRALQKLRDEEWWAETMTGLRPSLQQSRQQQRRLPNGQLSKASEASLYTLSTWDLTYQDACLNSVDFGGLSCMSRGFSAPGMLQGSKRQRSDAKTEADGLAHMLEKREDAEFQQKASAEIQDVPNTIPAFK